MAKMPDIHAQALALHRELASIITSDLQTAIGEMAENVTPAGIRDALLESYKTLAPRQPPVRIEFR